MGSSSPYTLSDLARRLETPQHRLIHLCEKGVIVPEVSDAAGRGSSRSFSPMNYLEFAVALRLRDTFVPVWEDPQSHPRPPRVQPSAQAPA